MYLTWTFSWVGVLKQILVQQDSHATGCSRRECAKAINPRMTSAESDG